jgi:hypothetical protein
VKDRRPEGRRPEVGEQLELGATTKPRDVWLDMLEKEFGLILLPLIDKSYSVTMCPVLGM